MTKTLGHFRGRRESYSASDNELGLDDYNFVEIARGQRQNISR